MRPESRLTAVHPETTKKERNKDVGRTAKDFSVSLGSIMHPTKRDKPLAQSTTRELTREVLDLTPVIYVVQAEKSGELE